MQHEEEVTPSTGPADFGGFDIIKACEGYLASFEASAPEEASPSYLHGWRMGRLRQGRYELLRKTHRVEEA